MKVMQPRVRGLCSAPLALHLRRSASTASTSVLVGPAVRLLLQQFGIADRDVSPSGPKGNLIKKDVLSWIFSKKLKPVVHVPSPAASSAAPPSPSPAAPSSVPPAPLGSRRSLGGHIDIPLTNMRKTIAKRLSLSKATIPHEYLSGSVDLAEVGKLREALKRDGIAVSVNDFIVKACASALKTVPEVNVRWSEEAGEVEANSSVDISVAVATPNGLITPIVFGADAKGVTEISQTIKELAAKAREGRLQPTEFQGGSFTISNLGMFGSVSGFTAIINTPQVAILTVSSSLPRYSPEKQAISEMSLTLCYDGRAVSPATASSFLDHVCSGLSDPLRLLLAAHPSQLATPFDDSSVDYSALL